MDSREILTHPLVSESYFFPRPARVPDQHLVEVDGATLACHWSRQNQGARTLVHFHGNGEIVSDYIGDFVPAVLDMGWNVFLGEYRGYGGSTGSPDLVTILEDLDPIFESLGLAQNEIVVFGRSLGSIPAIEWVKRFPATAGLVLESGISTVLERLLVRIQPEELGCTLEQLERACTEWLDHESKLGSYHGQVLVLHAEHDFLLGPEHAEKNHLWAGTDKKELVLFPDGDHNSILAVNWQAYMEKLRSFLGRLPEQIQ